MKKRRGCHDEDRLSDLPDEILIIILCHIPSAEAVRTCCLSSRWKNLWKFVDGLDVSFESGITAKVTASFIREFLSAIQSFKLSKVHVRGARSNKTGLHYYVSLVQLLLYGENLISEIYNSLSSVISIKHVVSLQLHQLSVRVTPSFLYILPSLRTLVLDSVILSAKAVEELICKCPSLRSFYLNLPYPSSENIKISHSILRYLVVLNFVVVELHAPALKYVELDIVCLGKNNLKNGIPVSMDVPSLAMCVIHNYGQSSWSEFKLPNLWNLILNDLRHVKTIHLDIGCKGLSMVPIPAEKILECPSIFIKMTIREPLCHIDALAKILSVSPRIEKLTLVFEEYRVNHSGSSSTWKSLVKVLSEFQRLKEVEIHEFIFDKNVDNHPHAARTLFCLLSNKLKSLMKLTYDGSNEEHKFQMIMKDYIYKDIHNFRRESGFEGVELPSHVFHDTCVSLIMN